MDTNTQLVPAVVKALASGLAQLLGTRLVGVYLGGSASMGDFVAATSDYDVLVVTDGILGSDDVGAIEDLHRRLAAEYPDAHRLEGDYAPRHLLVPAGTRAPVPGFDRGQFKPDVHETMLSADNIANMRESGVVVYGPPAARVPPPATPDNVRAAVLDMLHEGPGHCATERDAAAEILNLVRSLCALETGRPATKSRGWPGRSRTWTSAGTSRFAEPMPSATGSRSRTMTHGSEPHCLHWTTRSGRSTPRPAYHRPTRLKPTPKADGTTSRRDFSHTADYHNEVEAGHSIRTRARLPV
jgi:hypothetical protein